MAFKPRLFIVRRSIVLGYGSHVREPTPRSYVRHEAGTVLRFESQAHNGNVWFLDPHGKRGKIECGELRNLIADGRVEEQK